jgi:hypothetical protein
MDITKFLNKSKEEPFQLKIGLYLKSLETINDNEQGKRQKRAQLLLNNYRKAGRSLFLLNVDRVSGMAENLQVFLSFKSLGQATKPVLGHK